MEKRRSASLVRKIWCMAIIKTLSGATLLWGIARLFPTERILIIGWVGALGLLLFLFFGIFHIFALIWQELGINARHIMNSPLLATSLSDFWGRRWNLAVHQLAQELVFQPLVRPTGVAWATFMAFLASRDWPMSLLPHCLRVQGTAYLPLISCCRAWVFMWKGPNWAED